MSWLLPIGTPGGINSGFDGIPAGSGFVRLGGELLYLELSHYRLWRAAAAAPQVDEFLSWGTARGIADVDDRLAQLKKAGLLVEEGPDVHLVVGRLTLRLIGECLGNGNDASPAFLVLGRNNTKLRLDQYLFEILLRSDGVSPIEATCKLLDKSRQPGRRPCIMTLTEGLPVLVRNEVVLLEAAVK
jgi:hypothetical protein